MSSFDVIKDNTGLIEYDVTEIDGMECHFCMSDNRTDSTIIVFQSKSRLEVMVEDAERWKRFQHDLYYTDIRSGKSVGTVAIIYVLDHDASNIPIQMIESNLTYGRKYVFTEEEAITFLNGIVKSGEEDIDRVSPVQEWDRILGEVNLTGCLTETYLKRKVYTYLEGNNFSADYISDTDYAELSNAEIPQVKWVRSLDTTGFRDFCFDGIEMEFGQINLLYGANGSGKTSVLEAIEYALTSEVRRVKDFKVKMQAEHYPKVKIYDNAAGVFAFNPQIAKKNTKEIERVWYGIPKGRTKTTLNENFNRFNSFDSEAAYKFIHETNNDEASYSTMFGNLMFGEVVVNYEKNWLRYRTAFNDIYSEIRDKLNTAQFFKPMYESSIAERIKTREQSADLERLLKEIRYKHIDKLPTVQGRYRKLLEELQVIRKYAEKLSLPQYETKSFAAAVEELQKAKLLHNRYQQDRVKSENELTSLADINTSLQREISDLSATINEAEIDLERFNTANSNWSIVQTVLGNTDTISIVNALIDESEELDMEIQGILFVEQNINLINFLKLESFTRLSSEEVSQANSDIANLISERIERERVYSDTKTTFAIHEQQTMELRKLAKSLIIDSSCPLCGYTYHDKEQLVESIECVATIDNRIEDMIQDIQNVNVRIGNLEKVLEREALIDKALDEIESVRKRVPFVDKYASDYARISEYVDSKTQILKRKEEVLEKQSVLSSQGFSIKNINACLNFKASDPTYLEYQRSNTGTFSEFLERNITYIQQKSNNAATRKTALEREIQSNNQKSQISRAEISKIEIQLENLRIELYVEIEQAIEHAKKSFVVNETAPLKTWTDAFHSLYDRCEIVVERLENEGDIEFERQQLAAYTEEIQKLTPQVARCAKAVQVFETMPSLSSYVEHSIRRNIQQISKYFRWMHHSGEFTELGVDSEGLYAIRGIDDEIVRIFQMSTGQRTSIAMAVMLALYMAAPTAPRFLLLDEPLAHMDDTQVLNVLDIYKSIAEQKTQIFFTTANGEMIRHFKECFRDSKFDYKEYQFIKRVNCPSEIVECSINDTPSIEDLTLEDLTLDFHQFAMIRETLKKNQEKLLSDWG